MRVLTIGTFDMFHVGHMELLNACRWYGVQDYPGVRNEVTVGVNADLFVRQFKGVQPTQPLAERMTCVQMSRRADAVLPHWGREYTPVLIDYVMPDHIVVGDDWQGRDYLGQLGVTQSWLDERGISVAYVPRTTGQSSTALRAVLREEPPAL